MAEVRARRAVTVLHPRDNVATALRDICEGGKLAIEVEGEAVALRARGLIPRGHKLALRDLPKGAKVLKYGEVIGTASRRIRAGAHVHVHNVDSTRGRGDLASRPARVRRKGKK